jgi:hypothetical protein
MNKRQLHHWWTRIRPIKTWYLLAALAECAGTSAVTLRHNYIRMTQLRDAVYSADKNNAGVEQALQNLRAYVGSHMNTSLSTDDGVYPPIQLKYTYTRLQQAEEDRVNSVNSQIYTDAQKTCEAQFPGSFSGGPRVPCIEQYVKDHGTTAKTIPDAMYKFDFASPGWSPDAAGLLLVLSGILAVLTAARALLGTWLKRYSSH